MHTHAHGRHEHGQNFLTDRRIVRRVVDLVAETAGPIIEIGPGRGALTLPLERLGRPITAVEIHGGMASAFARRAGPRTDVVTGDFLSYRLPRTPCVIVGNVPFHLTTAILRKLLHAPHWTDAVLITQWEVARRRAGVGGSTMMTAQWAPFYEFALVCRVPARAYRPVPAVDGGMMTIRRRAMPLLPWRERARYGAFVHEVFTGRGRGIGEIVRRLRGVPAARVAGWLGELGIRRETLPGRLSTEQWAGLYLRTRIR